MILRIKNLSIPKVIVWCLVCFVFINCESSREKQKLSFGNYEFQVPKDWKKFEYQGIEYKISGLQTKKGDSVFVYFGKNARVFDDAVKVFSYDQKRKYDSLGLDTERLFFSSNPEADQFQGTFLKEYYLYDSINGFLAKKRLPKIAGDGITGIIYYDIDSKENSLSIISRNLSEDENRKLVELFQTIKSIEN